MYLSSIIFSSSNLPLALLSGEEEELGVGEMEKSSNSQSHFLPLLYFQFRVSAFRMPAEFFTTVSLIVVVIVVVVVVVGYLSFFVSIVVLLYHCCCSCSFC